MKIEKILRALYINLIVNPAQSRFGKKAEGKNKRTYFQKIIIIRRYIYNLGMPFRDNLVKQVQGGHGIAATICKIKRLTTL